MNYTYSDDEQVDAAHAVGFREGVKAAQSDTEQRLAQLEDKLQATQLLLKASDYAVDHYRKLYEELYQAQRKPMSEM